MPKKNNVTLLMRSKSQNESLARTLVAAFIAPLNPSIGVLTDVKTAVSEAVTNAIIHGYEKEEGEIKLTLTLDDGLLRVEVSDNGSGIVNITEAMEPLFTSKPEMERSGMGFTVMEGFMDSVAVESELGRGTKVVMTKRI